MKDTYIDVDIVFSRSHASWELSLVRFFEAIFDKMLSQDIPGQINAWYCFTVSPFARTLSITFLLEVDRVNNDAACKGPHFNMIRKNKLI